MNWLAFDIGCIECGEASDVIGVFKEKAQAEEACEAAAGKQKLHWTGQHSFEVFELPEAE